MHTLHIYYYYAAGTTTNLLLLQLSLRLPVDSLCVYHICNSRRFVSAEGLLSLR